MAGEEFLFEESARQAIRPYGILSSSDSKTRSGLHALLLYLLRSDLPTCSVYRVSAGFPRTQLKHGLRSDWRTRGGTTRCGLSRGTFGAFMQPSSKHIETFYNI